MSTPRQWRDFAGPHEYGCLAERFPALYGCFCAERRDEWLHLQDECEAAFHVYRCEKGHEQRSTQKVERQQCQTCLRPAYREPCR